MRLWVSCTDANSARKAEAWSGGWISREWRGGERCRDGRGGMVMVSWGEGAVALVALLFVGGGVTVLL
jgi:hypothetical protein